MSIEGFVVGVNAAGYMILFGERAKESETVLSHSIARLGYPTVRRLLEDDGINRDSPGLSERL